LANLPIIYISKTKSSCSIYQSTTANNNTGCNDNLQTGSSRRILDGLTGCSFWRLDGPKKIIILAKNKKIMSITLSMVLIFY